MFVTYWVTPLPPQCGRHISIAPRTAEHIHLGHAAFNGNGGGGGGGGGESAK